MVGDFYHNVIDLQYPNHSFLMIKFTDMTIIYFACYFKTELFIFGFGTSTPLKIVCVCVVVVVVRM